MNGRPVALYRIIAKLGQGGTCELHRATDTKLPRGCYPDSAAFATDVGHPRCEREAKLLASLNHANIAHIYGMEDRALRY
jgi:serine/threonine-protein kinase